MARSTWFLTRHLLASVIITLLFLLTFTGPATTQGTGPDPQRTGSRPPTAAELAWKNANMVKTLSVSLNDAGLARVNAARAARGLTALSAQTAVPRGQEMNTGELPTLLPLSVDNSLKKYFPPIDTQGGQGSCAAFSSTYYTMTYMVAWARDLDAHDPANTIYRFSPKWTYNMINGGEDTGSWIGNSYIVQLYHGSATMDDFAYSPWDPDPLNYRAWSTDPTVWRKAIGTRMLAAGWVPDLDTSTGLTALKTLLTDGYILNYNTHISKWRDKTLTATPGLDPGSDPNTPLIGQKAVYYAQASGTPSGHSMTVVGYNDALWIDINGNTTVEDGETGAFLICNSWGTDWGNPGGQEEAGGFMWIAYDSLKSTSAVAGGPNDDREPIWWGKEAYWITARPSYTPRYTAKFTLRASNRSALDVSLGISDLWHVTPTTTWQPFALSGGIGGPYTFDGTTGEGDGGFVFDFTDIAPLTADPARWYLKTQNTSTTLSCSVLDLWLTDTDTSTTVTSDNTPQTALNNTIYPYVDYPGGAVVTGIKEDSWAFGMLAALEACWLKSTAVNVDFSEQNLICNHNFSLQPHAFSAVNIPPVFFPSIATAYFTRWNDEFGPGGPVSEAEHPYDPVDPSELNGLAVQAHVREALYLPNDRNLIKKAIQDFGAVFATGFFRYENYSVSQGTYYCGQRFYPNTATAIVDWDDNFNAALFKVDNAHPGPGAANKGAFLVKNTFGYSLASVSQEFVWISYHDQNLGRLIETPVSTGPKSSLVTYTVQPVTDYQRAYGHDPYGWVGSLGFSSANNLYYDPCYFANVFTGGATTEQLASVGFYTQTLNTATDSGGYEVSIYLNPDTAGNPPSPIAFDTSVTPRVPLPPVHKQRVKPLVPSSSYPTDIPGYHSFQLYEVNESGNPILIGGNPVPKVITIEPGQRFSVVVRTLSTSTRPPVPVHYRKEGYTGPVASHANARQSFVSKDGAVVVNPDNTVSTTWYDLSNARQHSWKLKSGNVTFSGVDLYNNTADVCVKAYTRTGDENLTSYTVSPSAGANGTIEPDVDTSVYAGQSLTLEATPSEDYMVDTWTDNWDDLNGVPQVATTTGGDTLTLSNVRADHTVAVTFKLKPYTITPVSGGHGTISPSQPFTFRLGDPAPQFTATPEANYLVDTWYVNDAPVQTGGTTYTLTNIHSDKTVRVTFRLPSFTITPSAGANGTIFPNSAVVVPAGQSKTFTATPSPGYTVDTWTLDSVPVSPDNPANPNSYTVSNVQASHAVRVTFVRPPQTTSDAYNTVEDTVLTVAAPGVLANDTTDNPPLTAVTTPVFPPSHGDLVLNANGSFTYTPDANYVGTDSFSYRAVDAKAQSAPTAVTITVSQVNDPPVAGNTTVATYVAKAVSRTSLPGSDVDSTRLTYLLFKAPTKGRVTITNAATGAFTYTPNSGQTGSDYFVYRVFDGSLSSQTPPNPLPNPIPENRGIVSVNIVPNLTSATIRATPASPRPAGLPVTLLATSIGGLNLTYQFQLGVTVSGTLRWQNLNAFGPNSFFIWTPGTPGAYKLRVLARDVNGTTIKTVTSPTINYTIVAALSKVTLGVSPASPQPAFSNITLTATPVGGIQRLYRFVLVDGSTITELREYLPANTFVWQPDTPGIYHLQVWAMENGASSATAVKSNIVDYVIISPL